MILHTPLIGRFGNQLHQYAAARSKAEKQGATLATPPWIGERIFDIPEASRSTDYISAGVGYGQAQENLTYSRREVLNWLRLRPEIQAKLDAFVPQGEIVAHLRRGDYADLGYPLVSRDSYARAAEQFGFNPDEITVVTENPLEGGRSLRHPDFTGELSFLPDFHRMMRAKVLFRGNSSFSWWAGTLGEARVFSPCIKDKPGGVESDCDFSEGNHERFCNLDFVTDLHLFKEEQRYDYPLTPDSLVIDAGGYDGAFSAELNRRYGCYPFIFEPCEAHHDAVLQRCREYNGSHKAIWSALGGESRTDTIKIKGNMTGIFAEGAEEIVGVYDIADLVARHDRAIDLIKLNIEGMEYEVLERILECGIATRFRNIQVQFHKVVPDYARRYAAIREGLLKTHRLTFDEPWCWQNFELRA